MPPTPAKPIDSAYDPHGPLRFKVAPNIVEDLGLNLYTSLPRVIAEFVANAYDADSPAADITMDLEAISKARDGLRAAYKRERQEAAESAYPHGDDTPIGMRTLPPNITIVVEDSGCGMSREDIGRKFLVAGRRRREVDEGDHTHTPRGRLIMGRKGLGKLAGFGVAKQVEVVSRKLGEQHATRIVLSYDELVKKHVTDDIEIGETTLEDGGGFATSGTRVILSGLMHDPTKSRAETIRGEIAEHFEMIQSTDFAVRLNGDLVQPLAREFAFSWPNPSYDRAKVVDATFVAEDGSPVRFKYRMRFTLPTQALPAQQRGVRVYARGRLASAPSLLDADTNMHGFRMTDYLDGIVEADFLDNGRIDLIATDRQSLRWESPVLSPMRAMLSDEIKAACREYQKERDGKTPGIVKGDPFTLGKIAEQKLEGRDETLALRIATSLAGSCKQGVDDPLYKAKLPEILRGIGHGNLLAAIASLADEEQPQLSQVAAKVLELMHEEIDGFVSIARGRVLAIRALKKIVEAHNFAESKDEARIQALLESAPWLVDSTFGPAISANESFNTLYEALARELGVGRQFGSRDDNERPDLVFLLGNGGAGRLVIVELKAANVPLASEHLDQLMAYMSQARDWLHANSSNQFSIHGHLIGMIDTSSKAKGQVALRQRIKDAGPDARFTVRTFIKLLNDAQQAHADVLANVARADGRHRPST